MTCKDANRHALESSAWRYASEGVNNIAKVGTSDRALGNRGAQSVLKMLGSTPPKVIYMGSGVNQQFPHKVKAGYQEVLYEGYGPHGIAILVETATDNPTRTVANIRSHFNKGGGHLANNGSVGFLFKRMGVFRLEPKGIDQDELELDLIDHGLDEMGESTGEKGEPQIVIRCAFADFGRLQKALEDRGIKPISAESEYIAGTATELPEDHATEVLKLVDSLEQDDDVQKVFHNLA
jgi:YebC/PmpR family DNA-binding regulatory protein